MTVGPGKFKPLNASRNLNILLMNYNEEETVSTAGTASSKLKKKDEDKPTQYCAKINELADQIFETQDADQRRKIIGEMNALKNKRATSLGFKYA